MNLPFPRGPRGPVGHDQPARSGRRPENIEPAEPIEKAERNEPMDPIEKAEPIDPIDRNEFLDPIDRNELSDHSDHRDRVVGEGSGPLWHRHSSSMIGHDVAWTTFSRGCESRPPGPGRPCQLSRGCTRRRSLRTRGHSRGPIDAHRSRRPGARRWGGARPWRPRTGPREWKGQTVAPALVAHTMTCRAVPSAGETLQHVAEVTNQTPHQRGGTSIQPCGVRTCNPPRSS